MSEELSTQALFEKWAEEVGLNKKTVANLKKEELCDLSTLEMINDEELEELTGTIGQRKVLGMAVSKLKAKVITPGEAVVGADQTEVRVTGELPDFQPPQAGTSAGHPVPDAGGVSDVPVVTIKDIRQQARQQTSHLVASGNYYDVLHSKGKAADQHGDDGDRQTGAAADGILPHNVLTMTGGCQGFQQREPGGYSAGCDPRTVLTVKATVVKTIHITQFLPPNSKKRLQQSKRDLVVSAVQNEEGGSEERLMVTQHDAHPYAGISIHAWGAANCRLVNHLLATGMLARSKLEFYLAYTTTVFMLAERFEWSSILDFDYQYRELQAEHEFDWGTLMPALELSVLRPRAEGRQRPAPNGRENRNNYTGSSRYASGKQYGQPTEDCRMFKARGECAFGDKCKYRHVKPTPPQSVSGGWQPAQSNHSSAKN